MRAEGHAGPTVHALDRLSFFPNGNGSNQARFLALAASSAEIFMENHTTIRFSLQGSSRTGSNAGRILAAAADDNAEVAFNTSLRLYLDGAILQRGLAGVNAAACKHASQAADAALRMGHLQATPFLGPLNCFFIGGCFYFGRCLGIDIYGHFVLAHPRFNSPAAYTTVDHISEG
jgi:hypothetical protein